MFAGRNLIGIIVGVLTLIAFVLVGILFRSYMDNRLTEDLRTQANNRGTILAGQFRGDIQRHILVPTILQQDDRVEISFYNPDNRLNYKFKTISDELGGPDIFTVGLDQVIHYSSNPERIGMKFELPDFINTTLSDGARNAYSRAAKKLYSARRVDDPLTGLPLGIIAIEIDFARYQNDWRRIPVNLLLVDAAGEVLLATEPSFDGKYAQEILGLAPENELSQEAFSRIIDIEGSQEYVTQLELGNFNGWKLIMLSSADQSAQLLAGYTALYVLGVASLSLFILYILSRRLAQESVRFRRESEELRALNTKLITEIEQRQKVEKSLETAEQSLEQSSKLAVIGQMSAAIGHELNQPLAAMRTYLAGVRALLRRSRFVEAGQNINRVEDLLDRMGSITRQMRAFARAPDGTVDVFDLRDAITNSFELMTPQLGQSKVSIKREIVSAPVWVRGDHIRVEQILINLMRNAIEAVGAEKDAQVDIKLASLGKQASVIISDNGVGFEDVDKLFDPFYTTKAPGEGLGLGLAISAQYAKDMGGNLLARANSPQGAIFELNLPIVDRT